MATFYGYIVLVVGLSLLLGLAGIETSMDHLINSITPMDLSSPTSNATIDTTLFHKDTGGSIILFTLFGLLLVFAAITGLRSAVGGTFGIADSIKVGVLVILFPIILMDFVGLFNYLNGVSFLGGMIKWVAIVVYLPITFGLIASILDFIGGGK